MDKIALIGTIIGSAAFGAIAGKLIEAFLLTPIVDKYERKKWLRQARIEAYSKLIEEILSLGLQSGVADNPWQFRAISSKAILLIEDNSLVKEIGNLITDIYKLTYDPSSIVTSNLPENFSIDLPGGEKATKKDLERGIAIDTIEKEALSLANKLGEELRRT
jgi:hypothetical protein